MFIKDLNAMAQEIESLEINKAKLVAQCDALHNEIFRKRYAFSRSISEYLNYTLYKCIRDYGFTYSTDKHSNIAVYYKDPKNSSSGIWLTNPVDNWDDWENHASAYCRYRDDGSYYRQARHVVYIVQYDDQNNMAYKALIITYAQYDGKTGDAKFVCGSNNIDAKGYILKPKITKRCDPKDMYLVSFEKPPFVNESEFVNDVKKIISEKAV